MSPSDPTAQSAPDHLSNQLGKSRQRPLRAIWRRRWSVAFLTLALPALALLCLHLIPPRYTASTQLLLDPPEPAAAAFVESQARLILSDAVLGPVVETEGLAQDPEFQASMDEQVRARLAALLGLKKIQEADPDPAAKALRVLRERVSVRREGGSWVLDVSVSAADPERAAALSETVAAAYLADGIEAKAESTPDAREAEAEAERLAAAQTAAREAENRLEEHRSQAALTGESRPATEQELARVDEELALARSRVADARARLEQVEAMLKSRSDPVVLGEGPRSEVFGQLRAQYAQAAQQEAELRNSLGPRHPTMSGARAELTRLRRLISEELSRLASSVRDEHAAAQAGADALERTLEDLRRQAADEEQARSALRDLERAAQAARAAVEALDGSARRAVERTAPNAPPARVITAASVPDAPNLPAGLLLSLAAMGGLGLAIGQALLRGGRDRRIESAADLRAAGLAMLAALPRPPRPSRRRPGWLLAGTPPLEAARAVVTEPDTTFSTAVRRWRDALRERLAGTANARVLLAWPNATADGNALTLSLAAAFAERGDRVLLADLDAAGSLSSEVGATGLAPFTPIGLGGKLDLPHELGARISIVGIGADGPRSERLARLSEAAQSADIVLLCACPNRDGVLAADLVGWAAEVVLICRQAKTSREAVLRALEHLPQAKPISAVLAAR